MENVFYEGQVIWAMIDSNGHMRHSAYADLAAQARVGLLDKIGLTQIIFTENIGPVLFREETIYFKELRLSECVKVTAAVSKARKNFIRCSMRSLFFKEDGTKCAEVNVDVAWLDLSRRKLAKLNERIASLMNNMPKTEDFQWE